jgi:glutamyl-tRNA reductase
MLILNTCQRLETYGRSRPRGIDPARIREERNADEAIRTLARIACGLESRILGELEVLGQVREAYRAFHNAFGKDDAELDRLFQKAIALARRARKESGIDRKLTGLSALTARRIMDSVPSNAPVTIVGAGAIAKGICRYLGKRSSLPVRVSSRCPENAMRLAMECGGFSGGLNELIPMLRDARVVVTATAAPHPLVYNHHLPPTLPERLVIDLGEPPDCAAEVRDRNDIDYVGLLDIEAHAESNTAERERRAKKALEIISSAPLDL